MLGTAWTTPHQSAATGSPCHVFRPWTTADRGAAMQVREAAVQQLAELYAKQQDAAALKELLVELRPMFAVIPKAKTAKLVRTTIEAMSKVPDSAQLQVGPCCSPAVQLCCGAPVTAQLHCASHARAAARPCSSLATSRCARACCTTCLAAARGGRCSLPHGGAWRQCTRQ